MFTLSIVSQPPGSSIPAFAKLPNALLFLPRICQIHNIFQRLFAANPNKYPKSIESIITAAWQQQPGCYGEHPYLLLADRLVQSSNFKRQHGTVTLLGKHHPSSEEQQRGSLRMIQAQPGFESLSPFLLPVLDAPGSCKRP